MDTRKERLLSVASVAPRSAGRGQSAAVEAELNLSFLVSRPAVQHAPRSQKVASR